MLKKRGRLYQYRPSDNRSCLLAKLKEQEKKVLKSFVERKYVFVSRCGQWYLGLQVTVF